MQILESYVRGLSKVDINFIKRHAVRKSSISWNHSEIANPLIFRWTVRKSQFMINSQIANLQIYFLFQSADFVSLQICGCALCETGGPPTFGFYFIGYEAYVND